MSKITDNFNLEFPARMSDGRQFTDYRSNCILNNNRFTNSKDPTIITNKTSVNYKNNLTHNAQSIMDKNTNHLKSLLGCSHCSDYSIIPPGLSINCNTDNCFYDVINKDGLGIQ